MIGNHFRTTLLLTILTVMIMLIGRMLGGTSGMFIALILAGAMNFFSYWNSDKIVLKMYKAQKADRQTAPELYSIVEDLARRAGLPMPGVYIIPQQTPNAFATGRNPDHAVVAVTRGLLDYMNSREIAGVIAHELGHVKNRDILIGSIAATMAGAIMMLANFARFAAIFGGISRDEGEGGGGILGLIAMSVIAPVAAMLIQMAVSRSREYMADATSAKTTGDPEGLANALEKLGAYNKKMPMKAQPATAHMFIANPFSGRGFANLFSTHPPIEERIARLRGVKPPDVKNFDSSGKNGAAQARQIWDNLSR
jgi:heat shock protein HtpX